MDDIIDYSANSRDKRFETNSEDYDLAKKGDRKAAERLLANFYQPLCAFVFNQLRKHDYSKGAAKAYHSATDVAADLFFDIVKHFEDKKVKPESTASFRSVALRIVDCKMKDSYRTAQNRQKKLNIVQMPGYLYASAEDELNIGEVNSIDMDHFTQSLDESETFFANYGSKIFEDGAHFLEVLKDDSKRAHMVQCNVQNVLKHIHAWVHGRYAELASQTSKTEKSICTLALKPGIAMFYILIKLVDPDSREEESGINGKKTVKGALGLSAIGGRQIDNSINKQFRPTVVESVTTNLGLSSSGRGEIEKGSSAQFIAEVDSRIDKFSSMGLDYEGEQQDPSSFYSHLTSTMKEHGLKHILDFLDKEKRKVLLALFIETVPEQHKKIIRSTTQNPDVLAHLKKCFNTEQDMKKYGEEFLYWPQVE